MTTTACACSRPWARGHDGGSGPGLTSLGLRGPERRVNVGPPFSAATRDPAGQFQVASVKDYFARAHEAGMPAVLCIRVMARDTRTGRQALLWESRKGHRLGVFNPSPLWQPLLPPDSYNVGSVETLPLVWAGPGRGQPLKGAIGFYVQPSGPQFDGTPRRRMYAVSGANPGNHALQASFFYLYLETANIGEVGSWIRSLLW
jgi:hypothetical protein